MLRKATHDTQYRPDIGARAEVVGLHAFLSGRTLRAFALALTIAFTWIDFVSARGGLAQDPERTFVLLVGVSSYPGTSGLKPLQGPIEDVAAMRDLWRARGVPSQNITVLAEEGVEGRSAAPTKREILGALDRMATAVRSDDFVFVYFSGHGSQQPVDEVSPHDEDDGLDEVLLAQDVRAWGSRDSSDDGVITDNELGARLSAIRSKGPFVWLMVDACHSATVDRSEHSDVGARRVPPEHLGLSLGSRVAPELGLAAPQNRPSLNDDKYVAFFAAQSDQLARENRYPPGRPDSRVRGLFTAFVLESLSEGTASTFRELATDVFNRQAMWPRFSLPTPLFEGALEARIPFAGAHSTRDGATRIPVRLIDNRYFLLAGSLAGVMEGDEVRLYERLGDREDDSLMAATVSRALPVTSELQLDRSALRSRLSGKPTLWSLAGSLQTRTPIGKLSVYLPAECRGHLVSAVSERIRKIDFLDLVQAPELADVMLCVGSKEAELTSPREGQMRTDRGDIIEKLVLSGGAVAVGDVIERLDGVRRARSIRALASRFAPSQRRLVDVRSSVLRADGTREVFSAEEAPRLAVGDRIEVEIVNTSRAGVDVTAFYLSTRESVAVSFPTRTTRSNRLAAGASIKLGGAVPIGMVGGRASMYVAAVEAVDQFSPTDLSFYANCRGTCGEVRGGAGSALESGLRDVVGAPETRLRASPPLATVQPVFWSVAP